MYITWCAYRAPITIDWKCTKEFDYGGVHPTKLYANKSIVLEEDADYVGIGREHKDIIKHAFNAIIQAEFKLITPPNDMNWESAARTELLPPNHQMEAYILHLIELRAKVRPGRVNAVQVNMLCPFWVQGGFDN